MAEALRLFEARSLDLAVADAQVRGARADRRAAGAVANPLISGALSHAPGYDPGCAGCAATGFSAGVTDPSAVSDLLSGKRGLRVDAADAALAAAHGSRDDVRRTLRQQLRQAMLDGALAEAQAGVARDLAGSAEHTRALNETRYRAGAISEAELSRAEVAALGAQQAVDLALQAVLSARLQIAFLLGSAEPDFTVDAGLLAEDLPAASAASLGEALGARPDVAAATREVERAEAQAALARRQRIPDVSLSVQYQQQGSGPNAIQPPTWTFGAQLPLPIFDQQQGPIARADADVAGRRAALAKVRAQVALDVHAAEAALRTARALVERMQGRLMERATRAHDLSQVQYEKGAASLLELLDAQRTWAQTRNEYLKDLHDFWLASYQLDAALGRT